MLWKSSLTDLWWQHQLDRWDLLMFVAHHPMFWIGIAIGILIAWKWD